MTGGYYGQVSRWRRRSWMDFCLLAFVVTSASAGTNAVLSLDTLINADGPTYIAAREALLTEPAIHVEENLQPKWELLNRFLQARRNLPALFVSTQAIIDQARAGKLFEMQTPAGLRGSLSLGTTLARQRSRSDEWLQLAMAELLWKTSRNAYEKRSALHVLSLSEKPLTGLYEVLRDELRKCEHPVLAQDILSLITQYILTYGIGDKHQLLDDMMFAVRKFPDADSLHALASRVAREIDGTGSTALLDEIKRIEEQSRPAAYEVTDKLDTILDLEIE